MECFEIKKTKGYECKEIIIREKERKKERCGKLFPRCGPHHNMMIELKGKIEGFKINK